MSQPSEHSGLRLAPDTQQRLAELLAGQTCCRCGGPAARFAGEQFYCAAHFVRKGAKRAGGPRVYRCWATLPG